MRLPLALSPGVKLVLVEALLPSSSLTVSVAETCSVCPLRSRLKRFCASSVTACAGPPSKLMVRLWMSGSSPTTWNSTAEASAALITSNPRLPPSSAVMSSTSPPGAASSRMIWLTPFARLRVSM